MQYRQIPIVFHIRRIYDIRIPSRKYVFFSSVCSSPQKYLSFQNFEMCFSSRSSVYVREHALGQSQDFERLREDEPRNRSGLPDHRTSSLSRRCLQMCKWIYLVSLFCFFSTKKKPYLILWSLLFLGVFLLRGRRMLKTSASCGHYRNYFKQFSDCSRCCFSSLHRVQFHLRPISAFQGSGWLIPRWVAHLFAITTLSRSAHA